MPPAKPVGSASTGTRQRLWLGLQAETALEDLLLDRIGQQHLCAPLLQGCLPVPLKTAYGGVK